MFLFLKKIVNIKMEIYENSLSESFGNEEIFSDDLNFEKINNFFIKFKI